MRVCCLNCGAFFDEAAMAKHFGPACSLDRMAFSVVREQAQASAPGSPS